MQNLKLYKHEFLTSILYLFTLVAFEPAKSISQISFLELLTGRACHVCLSVEREIDVIFLDCMKMKAFDKVNHNKLLIKLKGILGDVNLV